MRLEKYQGYYIKKIRNGICQILDINQKPVKISDNIESAKKHIQVLRKLNEPNKYVVSAYDVDNDLFFDFIKTNSKKQALWVYDNAVKSYINDSLYNLYGFNLKDVDFIGFYENNKIIKKFDFYDRKKL